MAVITIISDYGSKDHYVGALKGALHREVENPSIVDITHQVQSFNIVEAAFILRNCYLHYPAGSIHLVCVDEEALKDRPHVVMKMNDQFFIASDNGVLSMINPDYNPEQLIAIDLRNSPELTSSRDIFARVAGHLARGGKIDLIGRSIKEIKKASLPNPVIREEGKLIISTVIYIDRYGNLITNLGRKQLNDVAKGRPIKIILPKGRKPIVKVQSNYFEEREEGNAVAIFNSAGLLEIALFRSASDTNGGARELLGMYINDHINIEIL